VVRPGNLSQQCRDFYAGAGNGLVELAHAKKVGSWSRVARDERERCTLPADPRRHRPILRPQSWR
jgi:hypothetical protein